jgi:osmotically-inducible protein OsmY
MKVNNIAAILGSGISVVFLGATSLANTDGDNSQLNLRDRAKKELTADQQNFNQKDSEITRLIRNDLVNDSSLSSYAQNVKIITVDGAVTLKGPVRSRLEETRILKYAKAIAGASNVVNKMEIVPVKRI